MIPLKITAKHIKNGNGRMNDQCPVALALKDKFGSVAKLVYKQVPSKDPMNYVGYDLELAYTFELGMEPILVGRFISDLINRYDEGMVVRPGVYKLRER